MTGFDKGTRAKHDGSAGGRPEQPEKLELPELPKAPSICFCCGRILPEPQSRDVFLLLRYAKQNDREAFTELLKIHTAGMTRYAAWLCKAFRLPPHLVDDIVQVASIKLVATAHSFECKYPVWPFVKGLLNFAALDCCRKVQRSPPISPTSDVGEYGAEEKHPLADLMVEDNLKAFLKEFKSFDEITQKIIRLRMQDTPVPYKEIGRQVGCAGSTAHKRMEAAIIVLLAKLE